MRKKKRIVCFLILTGIFVSAFMSGFTYQSGEAEKGAEAFQMSRAGQDVEEEKEFERAEEESEMTAEESAGKAGETSGGSEKTGENPPEQARIEDFGLILQMPELPTGWMRDHGTYHGAELLRICRGQDCDGFKVSSCKSCRAALWR